MRENTTNLGLVKPDKTDQYNVEDFNNNMQKIDDFAGISPARALTADKLTVGRNINGILFDGTKDVITGIGLHSMTQTYSSTNAVYNFDENNQLALFRSKQDENKGHATSETDWWEKVNIGGGAGLPILFIGFSLFVNEALGLDRYLNGQLVAINDNYKPALTELKKLKATSPSLFTTEENWQAEKLLSPYGQVGKFVIADDESTLRLPAVVNVQGLFDLQNLGLRVEAGLPNIKGVAGTFWTIAYNDCDGAFATDLGNGQTNASTNTGTDKPRLGFDASLSNPIYGNSDTVQPEAIQYPFFIRLATGQETEVNIVNEIELNNPYTLLESKYSESKLNNASWLRSEGQYNAKAIYVTAYEALQVEQNTEVLDGETVELPSGSSYTKRGLSVKLSTEDYTDYDFVLNTSDETFRLPIKSKLAGSKFVKGNGITLGLTNGTEIGGLVNTSANSTLQIKTGNYGDDTTTSTSISGTDVKGLIGLTTDSSKSGIELDDSNLYLYYYVGETVQNANLVNVGRIEEKLVDKLDADHSNDTRPYITETYENGTSGYVVYSNGLCEQWGRNPKGNQKVSLLKSYNNTDYTVVASWEGAITQSYSALSTTNYTSNTFDVYSAAIVNWRTIGYIS